LEETGVGKLDAHMRKGVCDTTVSDKVFVSDFLHIPVLQFLPTRK
jgi:hypothetical protein